MKCSIYNCDKDGELKHYPGPVPVSSAFCNRHYEILSRGYDPSSEADYLYFKGPTERHDTYSDVMAYYEFHGIWCTRQIDEFDGKVLGAKRSDEWGSVCEVPLIDIDPNDKDYPLFSISKDEFEKLWSKSENVQEND
ncbi:hypothetical protein [Motilimonas sp. KMU-193]|uniref:hypothetical protein n=1 Tax=Motilimonas sp. KMU-193 TaxID=3388668 RepID=UPI00396B3148